MTEETAQTLINVIRDLNGNLLSVTFALLGIMIVLIIGFGLIGGRSR